MGKSRPLFGLFSAFFHSTITVSISIWKKHRWCAWDPTPGPQNYRRRRNHRAMAATLGQPILNLYLSLFWWQAVWSESPSWQLMTPICKKHLICKTAVLISPRFKCWISYELCSKVISELANLVELTIQKTILNFCLI